jgi:hypothetical protein
MRREQPIDERWPAPDAIDSMLRAALPADLHALVPRFIGEVSARDFVSAHAKKRWGELSEGEGNLIAREVGIRLAQRTQRCPRRVGQSSALALSHSQFAP